MNINETTLKYNFCIGCGICAAVCPINAISMHWNEEYYNKPLVKEESCINCGICSKYCSQSVFVLKEINQKVVSEKDYNLYGLHNINAFLAWSMDSGREKSASGGIVTEIAKTMLQKGTIDAVLHASPQVGKYNDAPYVAVLSSSIEEIESRRGSFYCTIDFSNALAEIQNSEYHKILAIGTPCITRTIKPLLLERYGVETCYTIALACSHNVNAMLAAYMADSFCIAKDAEWSINYRDKGGKEGIENAANFNTAFFDKQGNVIHRENRFKSQWTDLWRSYAFSMNCCNSCSDFWGADADISVKDAWYKWSYDKESKSIVLIRNMQILDIFNSNLNIEILDLATVIACQKATVKYKQGAANKRKKLDPKYWNKIDFEHKVHAWVSSKTKQIYSKKGYTSMLF